MSFFDDSLLDMLDVYIYESNDLFEQLDRILLTHQQDHALTKEDIHAIFRAVSYTHLDVYKRQIEYRMIAEVKKRGMHSFQEFLDAMVKDESKELQYTMINQLTTNYTYFCREMAHYHYIETDVLPNLDKDLNELRILVAGCSSGQECCLLYTSWHDISQMIC